MSLRTRECIGGPHDGQRLLERPDGERIAVRGGWYLPTERRGELVFVYLRDASRDRVRSDGTDGEDASGGGG